ncbi:hypothetical protein [Streptomyces sp. NPDC053542]|uniref:hypothetical protein n=1 Tax=Streptomyces sp. NPDC053542 TaxID=3365710 RepID=UPI0037D9131A
MSKRTESQVADGLKQIAAATAGSVAGVVVGGSTGALVGAAAGPALSTGFELVADRIASRRAERRDQVVRDVARLLRIEPEELAERLLEDERLLELAGRVVGAAQDISLAQKRRALARALAAAVADPAPARLDIWELLQAAISEIDPPHIRFMHVISPAPSLPKPPERTSSDTKYGMSLSAVCSLDPGLEVGGHAVLQKLIALGLVESALNGFMMGDAGRPYALSDLGRRLLVLLEEEASSAS